MFALVFLATRPPSKEPQASLGVAMLGARIRNNDARGDMGKITIKLAELTQRVLDLEAKIALEGQQAAFLQEHGRPHPAVSPTVASTQKLLFSLKRSCQILGRHA